MNKENILSITLFVSIIVLNPMLTQSLHANVYTRTQQVNTLGADIKSILSDRGLEEEVAQEISENFIADNHKYMESMIENIVHASLDIKKEEILAYLANEALFKRRIALDKYDYLVAMMYDIKKERLDNKILKNIKNLSLNNSYLIV